MITFIIGMIVGAVVLEAVKYFYKKYVIKQ